MFEKEIEFIYKYNLNKIKHLGSFITYEQLLSTNIHPALLQYLSAEIDFLIYEDRQKLLKDSLFDYSGDRIVEYFSNIGEEIKRTKKFSYEYLSKLLLHASSFNVNFIIRPKWSLMQFVFENENEPTKQIIEVKQILSYLYYYPYLKRLLINFFNKKRLIAISSSELKELLDKIDKINYESNFDKVLDSALTSIAEFLYMGEVQNKKISKQFVELFLADKGLSHFETVLTKRFGESGVEKFDTSEFQKIIVNYISEEGLVDNQIESLENETTNVDEEQNEEEIDDVLEPTEESESAVIEEEIINTDELVNDDELNVTVTDEVPESVKTTIENEEESKSEKKSFLESHIENVEESSEEAEEDLPPDLDEATRTDEEDIDEIYGLATEEKIIDSVVDDETPLPRLEISDEDDDPFGSADDTLSDNNKTEPEVVDESSSTVEGYVEQGTSITFKSDELVAPENNEAIESEVDEEKAEIDDWPSESSSSDSEAEESVTLTEDNNESDISENIIENTSSPVMDEIDAMLDEDEIAEDKNNIENETLETDTVETQQMLFDESELDSSLDEEDNTMDDEASVEETEVAVDEQEQSIDISLLLENKKITKIIEVVFDYDMEEFANAIDKISECRSKTEAHTAIDEIARKSFVDTSAKEIKVFKNIISEFFK